MSTSRVLVGAAALLCIASAASAAISFTGSYSQNFDSMGSAGTAAPAEWGIYSLGSNMNANGGTGMALNAKTTLAVDDGSNFGSPNGTATPTGNSFNYGTTGSSERALGNIPTSAYSGDILIQAAFTNNTGSAINALNIGYTGEQWRFNQATSSSGLEGIALYFSSTSATAGFTAVGTAFDFVAPNQTVAQSGLPGAYRPLDGNAAANRVVLSGTYTLPSSLADGSTFYLRWFDRNEGATTDHGLAIDDVSVSLVPEPASLSVLMLGGLLLGRRRHN